MSTFYEEIYKLKQIVRRGWLEHQLPNRVESDAEHCFSMMMLALELMSKNNLKLDQLKVVKMVAYHELGEIDVGDIVPNDSISKEEKFKRELKVIKRISKKYNMPEILDLWLEIETEATLEAQFVKMLDKYDSVLQSKIYAKEHNMPELYEEFHNHYKEICNKIEKLKR